MLQYETIFIAEPTYSEEEVDEMVKGFEQLAAGSEARVLKTEKWGKRRLAYPIMRHEEGYYILMVLECPTGFVKELDRRYRMNDRILRHLTVRVENEAQLGPSPMMKPRPEREEIAPEAALAP